METMLCNGDVSSATIFGAGEAEGLFDHETIDTICHRGTVAEQLRIRREFWQRL